MLGGETGMTFVDFFVFDGKMGMFWIVQIAAIAATAYLLLMFRKDNQRIEHSERTEVKDFFPSFLLIAMLALLIGVSFIKENRDRSSYGFKNLTRIYVVDPPRGYAFRTDDFSFSGSDNLNGSNSFMDSSDYRHNPGRELNQRHFDAYQRLRLGMEFTMSGTN